MKTIFVFIFSGIFVVKYENYSRQICQVHPPNFCLQDDPE